MTTERAPMPIGAALAGIAEGHPKRDLIIEAAEAARGGPPLDLLDAFACRPCRDSGWRTRDVAPGEPRFGELVECSCAAGAAIRERRQARVWQESGIPPKFATHTLDTLAKRPGKEALAATLRDWQQTRFWLLIWGPPGTCKSGAAAALLLAHKAAGGQGLFVRLNRLLDVLQATFGTSGDQPGYVETFKTLVDAELLVLDDIGSNRKPLSPWGKDELFKLCDERDLAERQTILTTNLKAGANQPELANYVGAPTWDRMRGRVGRWVVETTGPSQRGLDL